MVTIKTNFAMADTEVTQRQYALLKGSNPSTSVVENEHPVETVGWLEAATFCNTLSRQEGRTDCYQFSGSMVILDTSGKCGYRLPTEAEWEFAARAPLDAKFAGSNNADEVAWDSSNAENTTHKVKSKKANANGLYDMSGNIFEWIWDGYQKNYPPDPINPSSGVPRLYKGGSWDHDESQARVAFRQYGPDDTSNNRGFRVVRSYPYPHVRSLRRSAPGLVPDRPPPWRRGHGCGVRGAARVPRSASRAEDAACRVCPRPGVHRALLQRSQGAE
ncbi:MAG TPA: formylglycine-generating enzyme family protein [Nitrospira sp.]|nr:formylglycine-generating enzyme family protein [Nitrospira sp.]